MTDTAHTPLPLELRPNTHDQALIYDASGRLICEIYRGMQNKAHDHETAALIVKAVNCHAELVEALKFYADQSKWLEVERVTGDDGKQYDMPPLILLDSGSVAQSALAKDGVK